MSTNVWIAIAAVVVLFLFSIRARKGPRPGPHIPFFGAMIEGMTHFHRMHDYFVDNFNIYGDTFCFGNPAEPPSILTRNVRNVEYVMSQKKGNNFNNYIKGHIVKEVTAEMLGNGIFAVDGKEWRTQRKLASHMFTLRFLRDYMTKVFAEGCEKIMETKFGDKTQVMDLSGLFFKFTLEHFVQIAFGIELGCLDKSEADTFSAAFDSAQRIIAARMIFPSPVWKVKKLLNIGDERTMKKNKAAIHTFAQRIIADRRKNPDPSDSPDLISRFIAYGKRENIEFSDSDLQYIALNFIIAGRDTTAQVLSWAFYNLTQNPEVLAKLREEADSKFDEKTIPDYKLLNDMPFAHAIVDETLRLHPPVPVTLKFAVKEDVWPDGTKIAPDTPVMISQYAMGRSEDIWGKDAAEWKPDRWLAEDFESPSQYKFPAFNMGPRSCLGKPLAYLEAKMILSLIVRRYDFELVPGQDIKYDASVTLPMKNPLMMKISPRSDLNDVSSKA